MGTSRNNEFGQGVFPDPETSNEDGLLAVGGNLDLPVLLEAYASGIFPWYSEGTPIMWWSPDPRMVLFPHEFRASKSLEQTVRRKTYESRIDTAFGAVIRQCAAVARKGQEGTWITDEMIVAYEALHAEGYAHSFESWLNGRLVGGLYGVSIGRAFFGESMFHLERDASKVALYHLVERMKSWAFDFIDVQQSTSHLERLGAREISRSEFLARLSEALARPSRKGSWSEMV